MGGPGSGMWLRWDKKGAVEDYRRLDVREIHREHEIKPGDWMTVQYQLREEQLAQEVYFDWTPCNYGGHQVWLICMGCGRKVAKLYLKGNNFACRHCHDLTYRSCQEADSRFKKYLQKLDILDDDDDIPLYVLKGWVSRAQRGEARLKREMSRRRRGRPLNKESEG